MKGKLEVIDFVVEKRYDAAGRIVGTSEYIRHPKSIGIISLKDSRLLMVEQYRRGADMQTTEIPAGKVREGETLEAAVHRELREETDFDCELTTFEFDFFPSPGMNTEKLYVFSASKLFTAAKNQDQDENIHILWLTQKQVKKLLYKKIIDAKTLLALYHIGWT